MRPCAVLAPAFVLTLTAAVFAGPPETRKDPVTETIHGQTFTDDYRWLEGDNSDPAKMGRITDEVAKWTDEQNAYTRSVLDNLPGRAELIAKLTPLMEVGSVSAPDMKGNRYFYFKREGNENQPSFFVREGITGTPKLLLNPKDIDPTGLTTISWAEPSHDGKLVAYGTYRSGDENSVLRVIEVDSGNKWSLEITGKVSGCDWLPDGSGFVYRNLADVKNPYSGQVRLARLEKGAAYLASDQLLMRQLTVEENQKLATTYGPYGGISKDGKWLSLSYATGTRNNDLWVARADEFMRTGKLNKREVVVGKEAQSGGGIVNDTMYMLTTLDAPNGRVVAVDLKNPDQKNWREIIPQRKDAVIQGCSIAKGILAVNFMTKASSTIELFDYAGKARGTLKLPGIGSAGLSTDSDRTDAFLSFTSFNYPSTIFHVDLAKPNAEPVLWEQPAVPVDPTTVEVKQEFYSSKDGTQVSMFIIHKKGLNLDGNNPTILYGYGGFTQSMTPTFSANLFQWFDAGGVYAVANLRGGNEYGESWHRGGMLDQKQNTFDDFAHAAKHLISRGYTKPEKLAVRGGSNGGLLTGAFLTQNPELCSVVLCHVPLLDMLRYDDFLMAKYWVPEYGTAKDPEQFKWLSAYSPYHHIKKGTKYPAVLFTAGENDSRVHPLHARKMAAAVQAATASDQEKQPVLLWVDREAGHGQGKPLNLRVRDVADERIFVMWQMGMLPDKK
ncbi:MAG TPA: prolyl oligopeptidase family serine peptidase [Phycisphaerales bacterium]|nr:prolyl oligopeptidase family serine peptidase [Phycisphaerales bacterium]